MTGQSCAVWTCYACDPWLEDSKASNSSLLLSQTEKKQPKMLKDCGNNEIICSMKRITRLRQSETMACNYCSFVATILHNLGAKRTTCKLPAPSSTVWKLRCNRGTRVFIYLEDLIVMARTKEWAEFHTLHLILHLPSMQVPQSTKRRIAPVLYREYVSWWSAQPSHYPCHSFRTNGSVLTVMWALGVIDVAHPVVALALSHMQHL